MCHQMSEHEQNSKMKICELTIIILILLLPIKGATVTPISVLLGKPFVFHLPNVPDRFKINFIEWKQANKLLATIEPNKEPELFAIQTRIKFMNNGSMFIKDFQREDAGNYTCKIISQNGETETHVVCLTPYSENEEQSENRNQISENCTSAPSENATSAPSVPHSNDILKIVIPVSAATSGLILLVVVITIIFKCRKKCRNSDDAIYNNVDYIKNQNAKKPKKQKK
ncbi:hypothetical protein AMEX_G14652 [Astyanax mexicanus]|uniref:Ig-like domain-containing protein n=1 Tax=Astyanax mexicanus TaxID=7994 RepID=A0A8T2LHY9_ASTMX|nr:hypothetical protein AMEX_G14652 [Astyanax mexicanus]